MNDRQWLQQGLQRQQAGDLAAAASLYRKALKQTPESPHAHYLLGVVTAEMGHPAPPDAARRIEAIRLIGRSIELGLDDAGAYFYYAKLLLLDGQNDPAIEQLNRAVARKPDFTDAQEMLANVYYELRWYAEAETAYRQAITTAPRRWTLHFNLGNTLYMQQRYAEALQALDQAAGLMPPDKAQILAVQALLLELSNQLPAAADKAEQALALAPGNSTALLVQAKLARRQGNVADAAAILNRTDPSGLTQRATITYWAERGEIMDGLGRFDEAFEAFKTSKTALAALQEIKFDPKPWNERLGKIEQSGQACFTRLRAAIHLPAAGGPQPIFILGFHRSGTTLVEQMLSSHPNIAAGGELELIRQYERQLIDQFGAEWQTVITESQSAAAASSLAEFRQHYIEQAKAISGWAGEAWFTDKSPLNSAYLLMLRLMFPDAPVLRIIRHPLDIALSCYFHGFMDRNEWSFQLKDIAWLYARLHRHMRAMAPALGENYQEVSYETLVNSPEPLLRRILEAVGEAWDPACLRFYENKRVARTASYAQVTQKLYDKSIGRHLNYTAHFDQETLALLDGTIAELGYTQL